MRMPRIALAVLALSVLVSASSCSAKTTSDSSAASETTAAIETTTAETTDATAAPVETTAETTAPQPIEDSMPEGASYIRESSSYVLISMESVYLLSEQEVTVVDEHVSDGITPTTDGEKIVLPAGTVAVPLNLSGEISADDYFYFSALLTKDTVLMLMDGRCVTFDVTEDSDGSLLFNGLKQEEVLGQRVYPEYSATKTDKAEGELRASEVQDPAISYKVLTINTDWNGDGVKDTFRRERLDGNETSDGVLTFTDGATGKTTDITKYCAAADSGFLHVLTDNAYFYEDEDGNSVILDAFDVCSSDYMTFAYTYDPTTIIAYKEVGGSIKVENKALSLVRNSIVFGNLEAILVPASITDNTLTAKDVGTQIWWSDNRTAAKDLSAIPPVYTTTFRDFSAEKITGDKVGPITIPAGTAVFPFYTVVDETGAGVLYFRTLADGDCQANFTSTDDGYPVMFGEIDQNNLFWCGWGD